MPGAGPLRASPRCARRESRLLVGPPRSDLPLILDVDPRRSIPFRGRRGAREPDAAPLVRALLVRADLDHRRLPDAGGRRRVAAL